jgi:Zn-dependent protease
MFISLIEIMDIILMIAVVGFIFMTAFKSPKIRKAEDELEKYLKHKGFNWNDFWFAAMVTAPAILLHELGHKITALSLGMSATFHAAYTWLLIAIILRLINFPFIFFVPAYVTISGANIASNTMWVAFAGPAVNLTLFIIAWLVLRKNKMGYKSVHFWSLTKNINLFLFIFNMIPIPGFDGFTVFSSLWKIIV